MGIGSVRPKDCKLKEKHDSYPHRCVLEISALLTTHSPHLRTFWHYLWIAIPFSSPSTPSASKPAEKYELSAPWGTSFTILECEPEHDELQGQAGDSSVLLRLDKWISITVIWYRPSVPITLVDTPTEGDITRSGVVWLGSITVKVNQHLTPRQRYLGR